MRTAPDGEVPTEDGCSALCGEEARGPAFSPRGVARPLSEMPDEAAHAPHAKSAADVVDDAVWAWLARPKISQKKPGEVLPDVLQQLTTFGLSHDRI